MQHRHLNHQDFTLAAIDDIIGNGGRRDWSMLRRAALDNRNILNDVLRICASSSKVSRQLEVARVAGERG